MKRFAVLLLIFVAMFSFSSCGDKGDKKSDKDSLNFQRKGGNRDRAKGAATIYDNDTALARDRALDDARRQLVMTVLGSTVSGQSIMKDFQLVSTIVESKSYGLVKKEKIIKENTEGNAYIVEIEGTVEEAVVEDAIEDALNRYGKPKFLVLIRETFDRRPNEPGFTESEIAIQNIMGNSGFQFIDMDVTKRLMKQQRGTMMSAANGQITENVQKLLLNDIGAEVVIIGTTSTYDQSRALRNVTGDPDMKSKQAMLKLKAVDLYTGVILTSISADAPGMHITAETASKRAIEKAMQKILGEKERKTGKFKPGPFINDIVKSFVKAATHRQINIFITGLDVDGMRKFRNEVSQRIRGVQQVFEKGRVGNAARVEIYFAGKTHDFVDELKAKESNLGFKFEIPEQYPNRVFINAKIVEKKVEKKGK